MKLLTVVLILLLSFISDLHPLAYESPPPKYSSEDLLKILVSPKDKERVCRTWPVSGIETTSSFIVDIQALKHPDDVFFGKWMYSGSHTSTYKTIVEEDGEILVQKRCPGARGNICHLRKLHSYHPSNPDFRRIIVFISGK